jgi:hypothetical protein
MLDEGKEAELPARRTEISVSSATPEPPHAEAHPEPQIDAQEPHLAAYPSTLEIGSSSDEVSCVCTAIEQGLTPPSKAFATMIPLLANRFREPPLQFAACGGEGNFLMSAQKLDCVFEV